MDRGETLIAHFGDATDPFPSSALMCETTRCGGCPTLRAMGPIGWAIALVILNAVIGMLAKKAQRANIAFSEGTVGMNGRSALR